MGIAKPDFDRYNKDRLSGRQACSNRHRQGKERMENTILYEKYKVLRTLSRNSTGEVFLAEHTILHTYRILKRLKKAVPYYGELKKEAGILKCLKHPCIPALYDVLEDEEYLILVEQYMEGESLKAFCARGEVLSEKLILEFAVQICDIMQYLHSSENQLLYLDLKPENILVSEHCLSLVDFGTAVPAEEAKERRYGFGTPGYAAPELREGGRVSERTDIYAIGMLIRWMLERSGENCGRNTNPNGPVPVHWGRRHIRTGQVRIEKILDTCTAQDPSGRYAAVSELRRDLLEAAAKCRRARTDNRITRDSDFSGRRGKMPEGTDDGIKGGRKGQPKKGRIGVYGIHRMAGTTCTAIGLALSLKKRWGRKVSVAILEMSGKEDFEKLEDWYFGTDEDTDTKEVFTIRGVDFWKNITEERALSLYNRGYDYLILDLGSGERMKKELLRCQEKLVIGSGVPWREQDWTAYFETMDGVGLTEDWNYVRTPGGIRSGKFEQKGVRIHEMPPAASVLEGTKELEEWFARLF